MRVLLVEDDAPTAQSIELMLKSEGFNVYTTDLGEEGVDLAKMYDYDCIVFCLDGPDGHHDIKQIRTAKVKTPILKLSGFSGPQYVVSALSIGADDYMTKPFHKDELVARIHAIVRRTKGHAVSLIQVGDLVVNLDTRTASVAGEPAKLTGKEYAMVELMALRKGSLITKEMFLNHLYGGMDEPEIKIIDVFICKLRRKLPPGTVQTIWGRGYMLGEAIPEAAAVGDFVENPPTGYVSEKTYSEKQDLRRVKSPPLVPAAGPGAE